MVDSMAMLASVAFINCADKGLSPAEMAYDGGR
jgi:hypothetical protein